MNRSRPRFTAAVCLATLVSLASRSGDVDAAEETRTQLKTYFETGDIPTQEQFANMIHSYISLIDDRHLLGLRTDSSGYAPLLDVGEIISAASPFGNALGLNPADIDRDGFLGLEFEQNAEVHFGYVHLLTDANGAGTLYPVTIDRLVFENVAGAPITISAVPEPASAVLLAVGVLVTACAARRRVCQGARCAMR